MTDTATPTLEARLEALEARLGISQLAATPPITIGELTNVPAAGSQLAAQWAQDVSSRVAQRFPTTTALKAWTAPAGAFAVALDSGVLWRRTTGGWTQVTPWHYRTIGTYQQPPDTNKVTTASIVIPADPGLRIVEATWFGRLRMANAIGRAHLIFDGVEVAQWYQDNRTGYAGQREESVCLSAHGDVAQNRAVTVLAQVSSDVGFGTECFGDFWRNQLNVTVTPKGY